MISEEVIINNKRQTELKTNDPLTIIGSVGVFGLIYTSIILAVLNFIPGADAGKIENSEDTLYMISMELRDLNQAAINLYPH